MKVTNILLRPAMVVATLALASTPAFAQRDHSRSSSGDHAVQRSSPARPAEGQRAAAPRAAAPRAEVRSATPRADVRSFAPRPEVRSFAPRPEVRSVAPRVETRRFDDRRFDGRQGTVVVAPRSSVVVPRGSVVAPRGGYAVPRSSIVGPRVVVPRSYTPRAYAPHYYGHGYGYRPYVFRPWRQLSFGLFLGYPVPYAYSYEYPVPVYGYGAPSAPVVVGPNSSAYGGVTLEMTPSDAEVIVDGQDVGVVSDFDGTNAPLNLTAGQHHIEVIAQGYAPLAMDVSVTPGQLVPYRGDLQPIR